MNRSKQISFSAGEELFDAIEIEAYSRNETIANTLRQIVAKYLADSGLLDHRAPVTEQAAASNRLYVSKSARHARDAARARP